MLLVGNTGGIRSACSFRALDTIWGLFIYSPNAGFIARFIYLHTKKFDEPRSTSAPGGIRIQGTVI
jgi:hypothetical protein